MLIPTHLKKKGFAMMPINVKELEVILESHKGVNLLMKALESAQAEKYGLLRVMLRYAYFNFPFAGSMASLAGKVASRRGIFRDPEEKIPFLADSSLEVAASIFFAAIDEFGGAMISPRYTHHWLARQTISAIAEYFEYRGQDKVMLNARVIDSTNKVSLGYSVSEEFNTALLFQAIGFHIGSEILAAQEFQTIDSCLKRNTPEIVLFLQQKKIGEGRITAYHWISAHLEAEPKHLEEAIEGANLGLRHCTGKESQTTLRNSILHGFNLFASLHLSFMQALGEP